MLTPMMLNGINIAVAGLFLAPPPEALAFFLTPLSSWPRTRPGERSSIFCASLPGGGGGGCAECGEWERWQKRRPPLQAQRRGIGWGANSNNKNNNQKRLVFRRELCRLSAGPGGDPNVPDDCYAVLGLEVTATESEVKRAYRRAATKFHPDVDPSPAACTLHG